MIPYMRTDVDDRIPGLKEGSNETPCMRLNRSLCEYFHLQILIGVQIHIQSIG